MPEFHAKDFSPEEKMYVLVEFPYPSGAGLHIGHAFSFTGGDVYARFQRMQGKNVLFPIGWDAFGLPTENYAIRSGRKPQEVTDENTAVFHQPDGRAWVFPSTGTAWWTRPNQITTAGRSGFSSSCSSTGWPTKPKMPINWCPTCKVGLANEEVIDGHCERCGAENQPPADQPVGGAHHRLRRPADLRAGADRVHREGQGRPGQLDRAQRGGATSRFPVEGRDEGLEVFTTRPDTLWGGTFMVLAPEHPLVEACWAGRAGGGLRGPARGANRTWNAPR